MKETINNMKLWFMCFVFACIFGLIGAGIYVNYNLNRDQDNQIAYIRGQVDGLKKLPSTANPYSPGNFARHEAWLKGWNEVFKNKEKE